MSIFMKETTARARLTEMKQEHAKMQELVSNDKDVQATVMQRNILMAYGKAMGN